MLASRQRRLAACLLLASSACAHAGADPIKTDHSRFANRIMLANDCRVVPVPPPRTSEDVQGQPMGFPLAAVIIALAPLAIELVADLIKSSAENAKTGLTGNWVATGAGVLFVGTESEPLLNGRCLTLFRGEQGPVQPKLLRDEASLPADRQPQGLRATHLQQLGLADYPEFYLEVWVMDDPGLPGRVLLKPQYLRYAKPAARKNDGDDKFIGVLLAFSENAPDQKAGASDGRDKVVTGAVASATLEFQKTQIGHDYIAEHPKEDAGHLFADQFRAISVRRSDGKVPLTTLNLFAFVTETEDPSPFYTIVANGIAANKDTLKTEFTNIIREAIRGDNKQK